MIVIDGRKVKSLADFYSEMGEAVNGRGGYFGANLDAFNDCLRGGFGVDPPFVIRWMHSQISRERLGYPETVRQLQARLKSCHPSNREEVEVELQLAKSRQGPTVMDWLIRIIGRHDGVALELS